MPTTTREAVDALLPPGTTVEDLSEHELAKLFQTVIEQAEAEEEPAGPTAVAAE